MGIFFLDLILKCLYIFIGFWCVYLSDILILFIVFKLDINIIVLVYLYIKIMCVMF